MTVQQIAERLVELCRQERHDQVLDELYSPDIVSTEPFGNAETPAETRGIDAVRAKTARWFETFQWNSGSVEGPLVSDTHFAVRFFMDITHKATGERTRMAELAVYEVGDGKIIAERFFYAAG